MAIDIALSALWALAPTAGVALANGDRLRGLLYAIPILAASLIFPPAALLVLLAKKHKPEIWAAAAAKPLVLAYALGYALPHPEPLHFAEAVHGGGPWETYAPLTYNLFKLAWWASPMAIATGGTLYASTLLYEALRLYKTPKEAALTLLMWPSTAFVYFSHHAIFFTYLWASWHAWETKKYKYWLVAIAATAASHIWMAPLALAPLAKRRIAFTIAAALAAAWIATGTWPAVEVRRGIIEVFVNTSAAFTKFVELLASPTTLAAMPIYLYILATSRHAGPYFPIATLGLAAATIAALYAPPDTSRGYISRFFFTLLPFTHVKLWPLGLASAALQTYAYGAPWRSE